MCSALARCKIELVYRSTAAEEEIQMRASSAPAAGAGASAPAGAFPTIQSHGARVARSHAYDWLALLLLAALEALLNAIEPFHRYVGSGMMADLGYPMKSNTVPVWGVPIIAVIGPVLIFTVVYVRRRNVYDLHHATLGILFSVLITGVLTDAIKNAVGRPRPNFFWRCFPDGIAVYDKITKEAICHGDASLVKEGHKSFPSGHASWSFAGLGFLSWYLAGKITVFDRRGHVAKLCVVLLPLLLAAMISISRVDDYWHHWQDVCTGGILGIVVASVCYLQFFPPPSDERGFWPHAHFRHISESAREGASQARRAAEMSNAGSTDVIAWQGQTGANTIRSLVAMEAGEEADDSTPAFMGVDPSIGDATGIVLLTNHVQSPVEPSKADAVEL